MAGCCYNTFVAKRVGKYHNNGMRELHFRLQFGLRIVFTRWMVAGNVFSLYVGK